MICIQSRGDPTEGPKIPPPPPKRPPPGLLLLSSPSARASFAKTMASRSGQRWLLLRRQRGHLGSINYYSPSASFAGVRKWLLPRQKGHLLGSINYYSPSASFAGVRKGPRWLLARQRGHLLGGPVTFSGIDCDGIASTASTSRNASGREEGRGLDFACKEANAGSAWRIKSCLM